MDPDTAQMMVRVVAVELITSTLLTGLGGTKKHLDILFYYNELLTVYCYQPTFHYSPSLNEIWGGDGDSAPVLSCVIARE